MCSSDLYFSLSVFCFLYFVFCSYDVDYKLVLGDVGFLLVLLFIVVFSCFGD